MFTLYNELKTEQLTLKNIEYKRREEIKTNYTPQGNETYKRLYESDSGESEIKGIKVHRYVVCNRCSFFHQYFQIVNQGMVEDLNCETDIMEGLVKWCYFDTFTLSIKQTLDLFDVIQMYSITEPVECLFNHLLQLIRNKFSDNDYSELELVREFFLDNNKRRYFDKQFHIIAMVLFEEIQRKQDITIGGDLLPFILLSIQNDLHIHRDMKMQSGSLSSSVEILGMSQQSDMIDLLMSTESQLTKVMSTKHATKKKKVTKKKSAKTKHDNFMEVDILNQQIEDLQRQTQMIETETKMKKEKKEHHQKQMEEDDDIKIVLSDDFDDEKDEYQSLEEERNTKAIKTNQKNKTNGKAKKLSKDVKEMSSLNEADDIMKLLSAVNEGVNNYQKEEGKSNHHIKKEKKHHDKPKENQMEEDDFDDIKITLNDDSGDMAEENIDNDDDMELKISFDDDDDEQEPINETKEYLHEKEGGPLLQKTTKPPKLPIPDEEKDNEVTVVFADEETNDQSLLGMMTEKQQKHTNHSTKTSKNQQNKSKAKARQRKEVIEEIENDRMDNDSPIPQRQLRERTRRNDTAENPMILDLDEPEEKFEKPTRGKSSHHVQQEKAAEIEQKPMEMDVQNDGTEPKEPMTSIQINRTTGEEYITADYPLNRKNRTELSRLLSSLAKNKHGYIFKEPVDPIAMNAPDYYTIIEHPMDISTIRKKMKEEQYTRVNQVLDDIELMWDNAFKYNAGNVEIIQCTQEITAYYQRKLSEIKFSSHV